MLGDHTFLARLSFPYGESTWYCYYIQTTIKRAYFLHIKKQQYKGSSRMFRKISPLIHPKFYIEKVFVTKNLYLPVCFTLKDK